jgi:hypothetical protein
MLRNDLDGQHVQVQGNPAIYLMDQGLKRHIPNMDTYQRLFGASPGPPTMLSQADLDNIDEGPPLSNLIQLAKEQNNPAVYLVDPDYQIKRWIKNMPTFTHYSFAAANIKEVQPGLLGAISIGPIIVWPEPSTLRPDLDGQRVQVQEQPEIYLMDQGLKRHIPNMDAYQRLFGASPGPPTMLSQADLDAIQEGAPFSTLVQLVRTQGEANIYLLDPDYQVKRWIQDMPTMTRYGFATANVQEVSPGILDAITTGPTIAWPEE